MTKPYLALVPALWLAWQAAPGIAAEPMTPLVVASVAEAPKPGTQPLLPDVQATPTLEPVAIPVAEPLPPGDIWQRIRAGLALPESDHPLIRVHEEWYARHPQHLQKTLERSRPYLYHIVEQVEKRGMPLEIALLPVIESSFNPQAVSPARAAGIWQFMPATGKVYGLNQNHWYDGRRDIVAATRAALDHLEYLHNMFGDWELALAAYNCGEGCLSRAIARNRAARLATDYAALSLPTETRHYVPKLRAVSHLVLQPERFGLSIDFLPDEAYFQQVKLAHPMEARSVARLAGMDLEEFLTLNPGYRRNVIYSDSLSRILLPVDRVQRFKNNLEESGVGHLRLKKYQASKGESIRTIAEKFDISLKWLKEHNPLELNGKGALKTATTLLVPVPSQSMASPQANQPKADHPNASAPPLRVASTESKPSAQGTAKAKVASKPGTETRKRRTHKVRPGDTLIALAKRYRVTVADIKALNGRLNILRPGDTLFIPKAG